MCLAVRVSLCSEVKAGGVNIVMMFISSKVEAAPCCVFLKKEVVRCRVEQGVLSGGRVDAGNCVGDASSKRVTDEC